ncbi:RbsD / FucU transport protein family protein [Xenorhabdus japonica]|uniref:D-ribose pyranase n=1 Tax=Xenorhabdus japonica TaxID=53341 RepID=A0A1I5B4I4_9GAMM|nr:RbsD / FucU transport protein family protein [Xenorhabdus japonica]
MAILAAEIIEHNPQIHEQIITRIADLEIQQGNAIKVQYVSHSILKAKTEKSKAVIRTGECSPYANNPPLLWRNFLRLLWSHYWSSRGLIRLSQG